MKNSTQAALVSFIPLGGWVASLSAESFWQQLGIVNLLLAFIIMMTAVADRLKEDYRL